MENPKVREVKWLAQSHSLVKREVSEFESRTPFTTTLLHHLSCHEWLCQCILWGHTMNVTVLAFRRGQTGQEISTMLSDKRVMVFWEHKWVIAKSASRSDAGRKPTVDLFWKERKRVEMGRPVRKPLQSSGRGAGMWLWGWEGRVNRAGLGWVS